MNRPRHLLIMCLVLAATTALQGIHQGRAQTNQQRKRSDARSRALSRLLHQPPAKAPRNTSKTRKPNGSTNDTIQSAGLGATGPITNGTVNYDLPNYANSPILRKFVDALPGLGVANANLLGQYIPVAVPDTTTYPGSDYYEIGLKEYSEQMHSDLPPTTIRGYYQKNTTDSSLLAPHYLGPLIIARRDRPVRVKFTNELPTGTGGNLNLPVDTTLMGAGMGPNGTNYTQNRATLHLHGGFTPWISDGTPHQWITPAGESTDYPRGVSVTNVPDMPNPGDGSQTFYYTNQQSARLMFYHDHAYGITRLNVYAGEAAGYILQDPVEQSLVTAGVIPAEQIALIIQDKTFVWGAPEVKDANGAVITPASGTYATDPLWTWGGPGSFWFPHVYMSNQDPNSLDGSNPMGRWDYGPWFWPVWVRPGNLPVFDMPATSVVPEAFMDTPIVNGTAYPFVTVQPKAYRLRILNACNDRTLNLQLWQADPAVVTGDGRTNTEVRMIPAVPGAWPAGWPTPDGRDGGFPDPTMEGPRMIQIGTEGGILPAPVVLPNRPIGYDYNRRSITVLNVLEHTLYMGPAERADVIVDFSQYAGKTLILYNDAPAPVPALDPRYDYFTGNPDMTATGGAPPTLAGYGPNTRTIMQIRVADVGSEPDYAANKLPTLKAVLPKAFAASQDRPLVAESAYNPVYGTTWTDRYVPIQGTSIRFTDPATGQTVNSPIQPKAIQELFDNYGRMNSTLGVELPFTNQNNQTTIPLGFIDPATETIPAGTMQVWKITHNGVDTHAIHFHLVNVQVINRVGWDGAIKPPDANELGWKETVKMNPLEDIIVAVRPIAPSLPPSWGKLAESHRPMDPTAPLGAALEVFSPDNGNALSAAVTYPFWDGSLLNGTNVVLNFGWEYVWHCHLLGHEENDMMRPLIMTSVTPVVDTTKPTAFATASPIPNVAGWNNSDVTVLIAGTDNPGGSGVYSVTYSTSDPLHYPSAEVLGDHASFIINTEGTTTVTCSARDNSGNVSATYTITVKLSKTPPTITFGVPTPAASMWGWNNSAVTIPYTYNVGPAGLASLTPASPLTFSVAGANQTQKVTIKDNAGFSSDFTSPAVSIDLTAPAVNANVNPRTIKGNSKSYAVTVSGTTSDNLSGVDPASGTFVVSDNTGAIGLPAGTFVVSANGTYTFAVTLSGSVPKGFKSRTYTITVTIKDKAGNTKSAAPVTVLVD